MTREQLFDALFEHFYGKMLRYGYDSHDIVLLWTRHYLPIFRRLL